MIGSEQRKRNRTLVFGIGIGAATTLVITVATDAPLLALAAGSVVAVVAYFAGVWLLSPVSRYVEYVQRLATGDFDEETPPADDRQYDKLSNALESMRLHLRTWMSQIARNAIEFEGSLQVLDLVNVMHFLRAGKRTGTLLLQRGGETAMLCWQGGEVCGALMGGMTGPRALAAPFTWERGSFKFSPRLTPVTNLDARWEVLLLNGVRTVEQPRLWSRLIPKATTFVRRARLADHVPLRQLFTSDEWTVWTALTGELSAEELSARLGEPTNKIWHNLYCFAALGVIEVADETHTPQDWSPAGALDTLPTPYGDRGAPFPSSAPAPEHNSNSGHPSPPRRRAVGDNVISLYDQRAMRRER